jgi:hypothetical protein
MSVETTSRIFHIFHILSTISTHNPSIDAPLQVTVLEVLPEIKVSMNIHAMNLEEF